MNHQNPIIDGFYLRIENDKNEDSDFSDDYLIDDLNEICSGLNNLDGTIKYNNQNNDEL